MSNNNVKDWKEVDRLKGCPRLPFSCKTASSFSRSNATAQSAQSSKNSLWYHHRAPARAHIASRGLPQVGNPIYNDNQADNAWRIGTFASLLTPTHARQPAPVKAARSFKETLFYF